MALRSKNTFSLLDMKIAVPYPFVETLGKEDLVERNLASWDRIARVVFGAALVIGALTGAIGLWGWVGIVFLATAGMNFCPLYRIIGFKTCTDC